jgi:hypothetical protein
MTDFDKPDASGHPSWLEPLTRKPLRARATMTDK